MLCITDNLSKSDWQIFGLCFGQNIRQQYCWPLVSDLLVSFWGLKGFSGSYFSQLPLKLVKQGPLHLTWTPNSSRKKWLSHWKYSVRISFFGVRTSISWLASQIMHNTIYYMASPMSPKINQILHCDWLPEWARWSYLACSRLPAYYSISLHKHAKKELGQYPAILTSHLVNNPYV